MLCHIVTDGQVTCHVSLSDLPRSVTICPPICHDAGPRIVTINPLSVTMQPKKLKETRAFQAPNLEFNKEIRI
jgi:hypothetical protein